MTEAEIVSMPMPSLAKRTGIADEIELAFTQRDNLNGESHVALLIQVFALRLIINPVFSALLFNLL